MIIYDYFMIIYGYLWLFIFIVIIYDYFWLFYGDLFLLSYVSVVCINEGPSELFFAKRFKN